EQAGNHARAAATQARAASCPVLLNTPPAMLSRSQRPSTTRPLLAQFKDMLAQKEAGLAHKELDANAKNQRYVYLHRRDGSKPELTLITRGKLPDSKNPKARAERTEKRAVETNDLKEFLL